MKDGASRFEHEAMRVVLVEAVEHQYFPGGIKRVPPPLCVMAGPRRLGLI